jgi:two-component system, NarL family, invasion response regulator UvrY
VSRIYLIDDHAMMRDGLRAVLEHGGHQVVGESDQVAHALADLQRLAPEVLLLDLQLGDRSGFEVLEQIQARKLAVRSIVLTMYARPGHVARALRSGASGYVLKGSPAAEVLDAVQAVAQGRRHLGPEVAELVATSLDGEQGEAAAVAGLSAREQQVIVLVVRGHSSAAIAETLHLSPKTVESYRSRLMTKLGVADVPALVRLAIRTGLISADES